VRLYVTRRFPLIVKALVRLRSRNTLPEVF
jgi:hypothetical protein